jgi:hypothetical protein
MSVRHVYPRVLSAVLLAASLVTPVSAQTAPGAASPLPPDWVVNHEPITMRLSAAEDADELVSLRQYTYLQLVGYDGEWARVLNPRAGVIGFVPSTSLGPTDDPPAYLTAEPPSAYEELNVTGRAIRGAMLSFYPTPDAGAHIDAVLHNAVVTIADSVHGEDGELWYRTAEGDYLPSAAVRVPRAPARGYAGRWLDADLVEPAMLTAYEGDQPVYTTLAIKGTGRFPTPVGQFSIIRRVANETMNSETIGIPRFSPGGYYLTNVLFTQYFTGDGASIHYNYWSSNWGYSASHGCLGLPYADSAFLWNWATLGTPVWVHR